MKQELTVLIVGGYGTFGGRIVAMLEDEPRLTLVVAGRSIAKARAWCNARRPKARLVPQIFDRNDNLDAQLAAIRPDILVDASGPFQAYGEGRYDLILASLAQGVSYLDLADGSDFVAGIRSFDEAARKSGHFVLSGVSSFPVLTAAVVRRLSSDMLRIDSIRGGIAPSPYAGVGENVIRAIAGYAGRPIELRRNGDLAAGYPFTDHQLYTIAPPGRLPLPSTLFSLVDVPDLRALAALWPQARTIWMGAGPAPEMLHRALIALAWLARAGLLRSLSPFARLMHVATNRLRWGEHRGGMFVEVEGAGMAGQPVKRSWHMLAEGDDGPLIPSMAVEMLVRKALDGRLPPPGARAAVGELELEDYERAFARRAIHAAARDDAVTEEAPLYARLLGSAWHELPVEILHMHEIEGTVEVAGRATVERGRNPLAWIVATVIGFPKAAVDTPLQVRFEVADGVETWTRRFGKQSFSSRQFAGRGRLDRLLCERFGPFTFAMALVVEGKRLSLILRRWSAFGVPLPLWLGPRSNSYETVRDGRFHLNVEISHPLTGLIVSYKGWLASTKAAEPAIAPVA